ncbi:hypothetical protein MBLNU459_g3832t1 [Dothideomycetes sp. NU459]
MIVVVLVVTLPVVYVAYPKISQDGINNAGIHITSEQILNPTADSADLTLTGEFLSNSSFHPTLAAHNASLYLEGSDNPFTSLLIPTLKGSNGTAFSIKQTVQITDMAEFTKYCVASLQSQALTIFIRGKGGLKEGSLPKNNVNYDVKVTQLGLNGLQGLDLTSFELKNNLPYSANSVGNVTIPNPSVFTLALGDTSLNLSVNGTFIGNATLPNLTLTPGNGSYLLYATANETALVSLLKKPQYKCAVLPVDVQGNASIFGGEVVPYFTEALQGNTQRTVLNLTSTLNDAGLGSLINGTCDP